MAGSSLGRRLGAEALGSAFLLATVIGSGIMGERLAGGNVALALLGNTLPTGAMLVVLIMLIIAGASLAFRGLASDRMRSWAGENILWIFIAAAVLGAASGLFAWFVNFDFGF